MNNRNLLAGNWKMNTTPAEGIALVKAVTEQAGGKTAIPVVFGVPFVALAAVKEALSGTEGFYLAAQNCHQEAGGAYTGETSVPMLAAVGVDYVIVGHSERREYFHEDDRLIGEKIVAVLKGGLKAIYCCGEQLEVREAGDHLELIEQQVLTALKHISKEQMADVVIAYEPVWAIGTGRTASDEQAQEVHAYIRGLLAGLYDDKTAQAATILYGGSVKPGNAEALFAQPDVDGGLVGGASLKAEDFGGILRGF